MRDVRYSRFAEARIAILRDGASSECPVDRALEAFEWAIARDEREGTYLGENLYAKVIAGHDLPSQAVLYEVQGDVIEVHDLVPLDGSPEEDPPF